MFMFGVMMFLHIVGSLALGFYLFLPLVFGKVAKLSPAAQEGTVSAVKTYNTYAQIGLVIQLLTGGYLMTKGEYTAIWMTVIVVLFLAIGAFSGIMGKPLRQALENIRSNKGIGEVFGKLRTFSTLLSICVLLISFFMVFRSII
ncbi:hypothetical protein FHR92_003888 [Fontibacillus solani]|uniref:DUF2269 family protein n=3 Tax=Paenibacillaceae TaxID=186822 RepID=A0A1G7K432_9BACL|nr:hypothetical protein [Fontibacillus solani]SDF31794.1 hypothetical protein SAMN04488542_1092 [Fontibacillus panacisegetis]